MEEIREYKGYLITRDWFGEEGIRIFSPKVSSDSAGGSSSTRETVATVDSVPEAVKYIDELRGGSL